MLAMMAATMPPTVALPEFLGQYHAFLLLFQKDYSQGNVPPTKLTVTK